MTRPPLPFVVALLVSAVVLFTPGDEVPSGPWWSDDVVHLLLFAALAVTGARLRLRRWALACWLAGYAAFSEVVQALAPLQRTGSVLDVLADLGGVAAGLLAVHLAARLRPRRRSRQRTSSH